MYRKRGEVMKGRKEKGGGGGNNFMSTSFAVSPFKIPCPGRGG